MQTIRNYITLLYRPETILLAVIVGVNFGNYILNLCLGRFLGPEAFAEAGVLATIVIMVSFLAIGIQLTAAKFSATSFAEKKDDDGERFIRWFGWKVGYSAALMVLLGSFGLFSLQQYLKMESPLPLFIILLCIPIHFMLSVNRGRQQGTDQFGLLSWSYVTEMIVRFIFTFALIFLFSKVPIWSSSEAVAFGFLTSFLASYFIKEKKGGFKNDVMVSPKTSKAVFNFVLVILIYECSQVLINNSDILLVKHYFSNEEAGIYSALALIGRVVFFATWMVVMVLFPKVIQREKQGQSSLPLFLGSLLIVVAIGGSIVTLCTLFPERIVLTLFGEAYISAAPLLPWYGLATLLFACSNVFAYYYMSLEKYGPVVLSVIFGVLQIIGIFFFHRTMEEVVAVQIVAMAALFLSMAIYFLSHYFKTIHHEISHSITLPTK